MSESTKKIIAVAIVIGAAATLIWGTYMPYRKSEMYLSALSASNSAKTLQEFLVPYMAAFEAPSPFGQEELVRNFGNTVANIIENSPAGKDQTLVRAMGASLDRYAKPVLERRSGLSQAQTFYTLETAYRAIDRNDDTKNFRDRYHQLLVRGLEISPDRPQFLYGLLDYEITFGKNAEAIRYANRILELWPGDATVERLLKRQLLK